MKAGPKETVDILRTRANRYRWRVRHRALRSSAEFGVSYANRNESQKEDPTRAVQRRTTRTARGLGCWNRARCLAFSDPAAHLHRAPDSIYINTQIKKTRTNQSTTNAPGNWPQSVPTLCTINFSLGFARRSRPCEIRLQNTCRHSKTGSLQVSEPEVACASGFLSWLESSVDGTLCLDWSCIYRTHHCRGVAESSRRWHPESVPSAALADPFCWVVSTCPCRPPFKRPPMGRRLITPFIPRRGCPSPRWALVMSWCPGHPQPLWPLSHLL